MNYINDIFKRYKIILENENNVSQNNFVSNFTGIQGSRVVDPLINKEKQESDFFKNKIEGLFSTFKSLLDNASNKKSKATDLNNLLTFMDDPKVKADLNELKLKMQEEDTNRGANNYLAT